MTREEAINKLKHLCSPEQMTALKVLVPELQESEDERIRKELIEFIKWSVDRHFMREDFHQAKRPLEWIAYLKRQKYEYEVFEPIKNTLEYKAGFKAGIESEKQKEQKPSIKICSHSIKSKSYKENSYPIEDCDYGLEIAMNILEKTLGDVEGFQTDDGIREHQTAIKAVKDAMKEQKPLSTEETELNSIAFLEQLGYTCIPSGAKPEAEWSKEDEKRIKQLIYDTEHIRAEYEKGKTKLESQFNNSLIKDCDEQIAWLKSLRSRPKSSDNWKPSEEQMKVFFKANPVNLMPEELVTYHSLYNDLKNYSIWNSQ